jgi:hypothetical protein
LSSSFDLFSEPVPLAAGGEQGPGIKQQYSYNGPKCIEAAVGQRSLPARHKQLMELVTERVSGSGSNAPERASLAEVKGSVLRAGDVKRHTENSILDKVGQLPKYMIKDGQGSGRNAGVKRL